jgi:multiple sugar transport system permease protein
MSAIEVPVAATVEPSPVTPAAPRGGRTGGVLRGIALVITAAAFAYPFIWLISSSLKDRAHVFDNALIPQPVMFANYVEVWNAVSWPTASHGSGSAAETSSSDWCSRR